MQQSPLRFSLATGVGPEKFFELDLERRRAAISPHVFGQFIEHLGRCIYGGIWAEMLEDRKFYFPITENYAPYTSLVDTEYPVVGASPWELIGAPGGVTMDTQAPFVGEHSPRLSTGVAIRQHDLGVVAGRRCVGYLWARAANRRARVTVTLAWGDGPEQRCEAVLEFDAGDFARGSFELLPGKTISSGASLEIRALDGDVVIGTVSLMPWDHVRGLRRDTLQLLQELGGTIYRWPGGNFVSGYDFRDGIGDRDRRPPRRNPAWTGVEHNDFGTDEFIDLCREIRAEPMIAVNTGLGDAYSAAQWVEYTNGNAATTGGSWRVNNGHNEPYVILNWCVGNEMFGPWQLGFMALWQYIIKHRQFAEAMWKVDPELVLVGVGDFRTINERDLEQVEKGKPWSERMLEGAADRMNLISEHFYQGRLPWTDQGRLELGEHVAHLKEAIRTRAQGHRELQARLENLAGSIIPIAMDEWNYWHREYEYGELGCSYDLADGLGVAAGLHEYFRNTDIVHMAHYAQTVNVLGAIKTTKIAAEFETTGLVLAMYRRAFATTPIHVEGDTGSLDVVAAIDDAGKTLTIGVVNPTDFSVTLSCSSLGGARAHCVTGPEPRSRNTPGRARVVDPTILEFAKGEPYTLPALSCAVIEVSL